MKSYETTKHKTAKTFICKCNLLELTYLNLLILNEKNLNWIKEKKFK